ncbi:MAG: helix-turn-helix transcriptional regulator [Acidimicrobiia bacterium]
MDRPERLVLSVTEAAEMLGISRSLAYQLVARGELPSRRLGGRIVVLLRPLQRLLDGEHVDDAAETVKQEPDGLPVSPARSLRAL